MKLEPIETAPKDREILVYGEWSWGTLSKSVLSRFSWKVAKWADYIGKYNNETYEYISSGGFASVTEHPEADYAEGIYWCELPVIEE